MLIIAYMWTKWYLATLTLILSKLFFGIIAINITIHTPTPNSSISQLTIIHFAFRKFCF